MPVEQKKDILKRAYVIYFFICLFGLSVMVKIGYIQLVEGEKWRSKAESLTTVYRDIEAVRGNIYADDGSMLATSVPIYEIRMDPNADALTDDIFNTEVDSLAISLSQLFHDKSPVEWKRDLVNARSKGARYHLIKRNVKYAEMTALREFPIFRRGKFKGGLIILQQNKRVKPFRMLAARTIGYDREDIAPVGLEGAYRKELGGVSGKRLMQKISGGIWMPLNDENEVEPQDGYDIQTTINLNIQDVAESALLKELQRHDAHHGCVILMEVATGAIKAIANLSRDDDGDYWEYYNYAIGESAEPGSTFKLPSLIVALEDGFVELTDSVETGDGEATFYGEKMRDSKEDGYGTITIKDAFAHSSNIGIMRVIDQYYSTNPQKFIDGLTRMELDKKLGLQISGEGEPFIKQPSDKSWSLISHLWTSIGYETKMTPMQVLTFYNAIANNGVMVKPRFVSRVTDKSKVIREYKPDVINGQICSEETVKKAREMLEAVVEYGTAKNLQSPDYKIAGKTGTARIAQSSLGYGKVIEYQASFVGYFPADKPQYSCIVVVNAPNRNNYYASHVAGPIFKQIADKVYATSIQIHDELQKQEPGALTAIPVSKGGYQDDLATVFDELEIPVKSGNPENKWVETQTGKDQVGIKRRNMIENLVPNVQGMAIQDAIFILENNGLKVNIKGRGTIKRQSITPGERIVPGQTITLELS